MTQTSLLILAILKIMDRGQDTCTWTLPGETLTYDFNVLWFNFLQSKILQLQGLG